MVSRRLETQISKFCSWSRFEGQSLGLGLEGRSVGLVLGLEFWSLGLGLEDMSLDYKSADRLLQPEQRHQQNSSTDVRRRVIIPTKYLQPS